MYRTVAVPVDGSPLAEHAIPWALAAAGDGSAVHLVHVHLPAAPVVVEGVVVADPGHDENLRQLDADYVAKLAVRVRQSAPQVRVSGLALDADEPLSEALADTAKELSAELLVMTTHGRGPFARFLLGSVTDDTIRSSPVPVLIVRGAEDRGPDLTARPTVTGGVLVPLDGSSWSEAILDPAVRLARVFRCGITLMKVTDGDRAEQPERYLQRAAAGLAEQGVTATASLLRAGDPAEAILNYTKANPGTVVALATHGRTGFSRLMHRSVTEDVLHATASPILVYRPTK